MAMIKNFLGRLKKTVTLYRIKKYGIIYVFLEVLIILCHRTNTSFEHHITYVKDKIINQYLNDNYKSIIDKYY